MRCLWRGICCVLIAVRWTSGAVAGLASSEKEVVRLYPTPELLRTATSSAEDVGRDVLHYTIAGEGMKPLHLRLTRNKHLLTPDAASEMEHEISCLYEGQIATKSRSMVAINLCTGMGSLLFDEGRFILESAGTDEGIDDNEGMGAEEKLLVMYRYNLAGSNDDADSRTEQKRRRSRRQVHSSAPAYFSREKKVVETLVVVDKSLQDKYGQKEATTYVLTVLNTVSGLFHDKSLGIEINIMISGLVFLTGNEEGLSLRHQANLTLNSFCEWQQSLKDTFHHDHAILMTGIDICVEDDKPCDTIGYAPIDGMCSPTRSCTVNEDRGLGVAFTIAHELGHNLGMLHDGVDNDCQEAGGIMGPSLVSQNGVFFWSHCNRQQLNQFLNTEKSACLDHETQQRTSAFSLVPMGSSQRRLPGEVYSADQQCQHVFGKQASVCQFTLPDGADVCRYLWCFVGQGRCETKFLPAAEGTSCGRNKWCRRGTCVRRSGSADETPVPVDGKWSEWSAWSQCSRSCGGGIMTRRRDCNNPRPEHGGQNCQGAYKEMAVCGQTACPTAVSGDSKASFSEDQCTQHFQSTGAKYYVWADPRSRGTVTPSESCQLICKSAAYPYNIVKVNKPDGVPCSAATHDSTSDVCYDGRCTPVGCDLTLLSPARMDRCGVCSGDGSTCEVIKGTFTDPIRTNEYKEFLTLPAGAKFIKVKEMQASRLSYIGLRDSAGHYHVNSRKRLSTPGNVQAAGATFAYRRDANGLESLQSDGPLADKLFVDVLTYHSNPGVMYEYVVPLVARQRDNPAKDNFVWAERTSACSASCGEGVRFTNAVCLLNDAEEVNDSYCDDAVRIPARVDTCTAAVPCAPRWVPQQWQQCSKPCGGGKQKRKLVCAQQMAPNEDKVVRDKACSDAPKPERVRSCNEAQCKPEWWESAWSECSADCGYGQQKREVLCVHRSDEGAQRMLLNDSDCAAAASSQKPSETRVCLVRQCPGQWRLTAWSQCSKTCGGEGVQARSLVCVHQEEASSNEVWVDVARCEDVPQPVAQLLRSCEGQPSCPAWRVSQWQQCSVSCGDGVMSRRVTCADDDGTEVNGCDESQRPQSSGRCNEDPCRSKSTPTTTFPKHNSIPARIAVGAGEEAGMAESEDDSMSAGQPSSNGLNHKAKEATTTDVLGTVADGMYTDPQTDTEKTTTVPAGTSPPASAVPTASLSCEDKRLWCPTLVRYKYYCTKTYYSSLCCKSCSSGLP